MLWLLMKEVLMGIFTRLYERLRDKIMDFGRDFNKALAAMEGAETSWINRNI